MTMLKFLILILLIINTNSISLFAAKIGVSIETITVRDIHNKPAKIPEIGKKVIALFYTDPDESNMNETFRDLLKAENFPKDKYAGIGIVNMKAAPWKPNSLIRMMIKVKINKYKSTILTDSNYSLKEKWKLGNCNDKDICIIIGTDKKIKYIYKDKMDTLEIKKALKILKKLIYSDNR